VSVTTPAIRISLTERFISINAEPVGDRLMFFAENDRPTLLPHSRIALLAALQRGRVAIGLRLCRTLGEFVRWQILTDNASITRR
jgi:hypothetical protein